jgi:hypothetical protein
VFNNAQKTAAKIGKVLKAISLLYQFFIKFAARNLGETHNYTQ